MEGTTVYSKTDPRPLARRLGRGGGSLGFQWIGWSRWGGASAALPHFGRPTVYGRLRFTEERFAGRAPAGPATACCLRDGGAIVIEAASC